MIDPKHPEKSDGSAPAATHASPPDPGALRESWRSEELLGERTEVLILHGTEIYRLRRTRQGKLILYK